jgi:hypothetical protein
MPTQPVADTVPKVNDELAVGEDLRFQRRWWRFENGVWIFFTLVIALDLAGVFGRGPMANARAATGDQALQVKYERVERFETPSILTVNFGSKAIRQGRAELWVSEDLVKALGNQRVIPQPVDSKVGGNGVLYSFAATAVPATAAFALEPAQAGLHTLRLRIPGMEELVLKILVMP